MALAKMKVENEFISICWVKGNTAAVFNMAKLFIMSTKENIVLCI